MFGIRSGDMPDPAPLDIRGKGPAPGYSVYRFPSAQAVNDFCVAQGQTPEGYVKSAQTFRRPLIRACVDGDLGVVAMPPVGTMRPEADEATLDHENGHTWGYYHTGTKRSRDWVKGPRIVPWDNPELVRQIVEQAGGVLQVNPFAVEAPANQPDNPFRGR